LLAGGAILWSAETTRAEHVGVAQERAPEAGERQRELLSARPVARAMFRARQSDGSLDPPPVAVVAAPTGLVFRLAATGGKGRPSCSLTAASSVGHFPRGPPGMRSKPSPLERT
jgi:hypothetical protein